MFCVSLSYKNTPLKIRERFAFSSEKTEQFLASLKNKGINQCVYVSTCNRCEIYFEGEIQLIWDVLSFFSNLSVSEIKSYVMVFYDKDAIKHLFSVCNGLDSMVLGEDEILGQVKKAYKLSLDGGYTGYELNTVFRAAVTDAKLIKTKTMLSKISVSVATLAAAKCRKFLNARKKVLIIGASGDTGKKIIKNLLSYGDCDIFAAVRKKDIDEKGVITVSYSERYNYVDMADIIISATKSPHFTLTADNVREKITLKKSRLFIDLSVPKDIDSNIAMLDEAELLTIDDFEKIAKDNSAIKEKEVNAANDIMLQRLDVLFKELLFHRHLPKLQGKYGEKSEIMKFIYKFRDNASADELDAFFSVISKTEDE